MADTQKDNNQQTPEASAPKDKTPTKKPALSMGGRSRRRRGPTLTEEQIEAQMREEVEKELGPKKSEEPAKTENDTPAPEDDKELLTIQYRAKIATYNSLAETLAEKKTDLAAKNQKRTEIMAQTEAAKDKASYAFDVEKFEKVKAFIDELKDVQEALGGVVSEIEELAENDEALEQFVAGLRGTTDSLTKTFNSFGTKEPQEPKNEEVTPAPSFEANTLPVLTITEDTAVEDIKAALENVEGKLAKTEDDMAKTDAKLEKIDEMVSRAEESSAKEISRHAKELESKAPFVLEKAAKSVLDVADNLERALKALEPQKDNLGSTFDEVAAKVTKAEAELQDAFNKFGIKKIDTKIGQEPNIKGGESVVAMVPSDQPKGTVAAIGQAGYTLNDRPIRDAMVMVSK